MLFHPSNVQIIDRKASTILGLKDALKLNLLNLHPDVHEISTQQQQSQTQTKSRPTHIPVDIWSSHNDLFTDTVGCLPVVYKMKLNPNIEPVIRPARKIPHAMSDKIKKSLDEMEQNGIITKVCEPTSLGFINGRRQEKEFRQFENLY